jgi:transcriptional regulator with XRE-family HTH domain
MESTNYPRLPDAILHKPEPDYLRELLEKSGYSQRAAARALGVDDRTMRYYFAGEREFPYSLQFALERLAAAAGAGDVGQVADAPKLPTWTRASKRAIAAADVGKLVMARDADNGFVMGRVKQDGFGIVIEALPGRGSIDGGNLAASAVKDYVLVEDPDAY